MSAFRPYEDVSLHNERSWPLPGFLRSTGRLRCHGAGPSGLVTEGDILEETRAMVKDAIRGYLESLVKHGEEIPLEPNPAMLERVEVNI
jgi:predicted RNase H-like HicB family nuclease